MKTKVPALLCRLIALFMLISFFVPDLLSAQNHSATDESDITISISELQLQPSSWFETARQCPDTDYEKTFGTQEGASSGIGQSEGLQCLGQALLNDCEEVWSAASSGTDIAAITKNGNECLLAYRTELNDDYFACDPYGFFLEYMDFIGQIVDISEARFLEMMEENPSAGMANIIALQSVQYLNSRSFLNSVYTTCSWIELEPAKNVD